MMSYGTLYLGLLSEWKVTIWGTFCELCAIVFVLINDTMGCISVSALQFKILCRCSGKSICAPTSASGVSDVVVVIVLMCD